MLYLGVYNRTRYVRSSGRTKCKRPTMGCAEQMVVPPELALLDARKMYYVAMLQPNGMQVFTWVIATGPRSGYMEADMEKLKKGR